MDFDKIQKETEAPYSPRTKKDPAKIDPEKFKKIMKVEESQEAEKRKKRSLPKEEQEEEMQPIESSPSPAASFSEYMNDKEPLSSIFDKESGGVRIERINPNTSASSANAPRDSFAETFHAPVDPSSSPPLNAREDQVIKPQLFSSPTSSFENKHPASPSSTQDEKPTFPPTQEDSSNPFFEKESSSTEEEVPFAKDLASGKKREKPKRKKPVADSSLLASQPKTKRLDALKKKKKKDKAATVKTVVQKKIQSEGKNHTKETVFPEESFVEKTTFFPTDALTTPHLKKDKKQKALNPKTKGGPSLEALNKEVSQTPDARKEKKEAFFHRLTPEESRNRKLKIQKMKERAFPFTIEKSSIHQETKEKKETGFTEATSKAAGIPLPPLSEISFPSPPLTEMASCTKLSPSVFALFEKMSAFLIIQQEKGVSTTTLNISIPGSVFNDTQVMIKQYNTAPNAYNIQLIGNPKSVQIFNENLDLLQKSFIEGRFGFEVHILNPILSTEKKSPHLIRRKGKTGEEGGKQEK